MISWRDTLIGTEHIALLLTAARTPRSSGLSPSAGVSVYSASFRITSPRPIHRLAVTIRSELFAGKIHGAGQGVEDHV